MAQQSARRGRDNQGFPQCFEHALGDMDQARELPYRPAAAQRRITGRTDGCIRLRATNNPEVAANKARDKKAAMDYLAHAQAAMDARD